MMNANIIFFMDWSENELRCARCGECEYVINYIDKINQLEKQLLSARKQIKALKEQIENLETFNCSEYPDEGSWERDEC